MDKLYNLFEQVILESVSRDKVIDCIENKYRVNITYAGTNDTATEKRHIEVYAYGTTESGYPVIRAFQLFGDTKTIKPAWKFFRLDRILSWTPTNFKFHNPVSDRDSTIPKYKEDGSDNTMKFRPIMTAKFDNKNRKK